MRDNRFVAIHRGGLLTLDLHRQIVLWACNCSENVLSLFSNDVDIRLTNAIKTAKQWTNGEATVGDARNASLEVIALARELTNPIEISIARSVSHAVATVHMADHSLRAAEYALKAVKLTARSIDEERKYQDKILSPAIFDLIFSSRKQG